MNNVVLGRKQNKNAQTSDVLSIMGKGGKGLDLDTMCITFISHELVLRLVILHACTPSLFDKLPERF